jgi:hypothetical protein
VAADLAAADPDGGRVVPECPAGDAGKAAEPVPGGCRRELLVDHGVPALPVQGRGMDQTQQVRAERQGGGHGCYRRRGSGQAVRTGMAVRPRPGSSAIRTPAAAVTGAPAAGYALRNTAN